MGRNSEGQPSRGSSNWVPVLARPRPLSCPVAGRGPVLGYRAVPKIRP